MGQERWSSIWDGRRRPPLAAYPRLSGAGRTLPPIWPCSGWGLPCHHCYQWCGGLLPHRFTLTRISGEPSIRAVCFLWPCPSPCGAQALPGSLPCGARTFLGYLAAPATILSDQWMEYSGEAGKWGCWEVGPAYRLPRCFTYPACPTRARPRSACCRNGRSAGSARFHCARTWRYCSRASALRPSRS
jgi:hypothetical protein